MPSVLQITGMTTEYVVICMNFFFTNEMLHSPSSHFRDGEKDICYAMHGKKIRFLLCDSF